MDIGLQIIPDRAIQRRSRGMGRGGLIVAEIGLDVILVGSHAKDVRGDLQPLQQLAEIEIVATRPRQERAAQRVDPRLAGMGGQQHSAILQHGAPQQHRLFRGAHRVHGRADFLQMHQPAAAKPADIHHHRLDPRIGCRLAQRPHHIALAGLALSAAALHQRQRVGLARLFHHGAIEAHQQRAILHPGGRATA